MDENSTLSPSQANSIQQQLNDFLSNCKVKIDNACDSFTAKIQDTWEDPNAMSYMSDFKQAMINVVDELTSNNKVFNQTLQGVCDSYDQTAGRSGSFTEPASSFTSNVDVSKIQDKFEDDSFGFKNPANGASQVMDAFEELTSIISSAIEEVRDRIGNVNAFGYKDINRNFGDSAGTLVKIVGDQINNLKTSINENVDKTSQTYLNLAQNAASAAKISAE